MQTIVEARSLFSPRHCSGDADEEDENELFMTPRSSRLSLLPQPSLPTLPAYPAAQEPPCTPIRRDRARGPPSPSAHDATPSLLLRTRTPSNARGRQQGLTTPPLRNDASQYEDRYPRLSQTPFSCLATPSASSDDKPVFKPVPHIRLDQLKHQSGTPYASAALLTARTLLTARGNPKEDLELIDQLIQMKGGGGSKEATRLSSVSRIPSKRGSKHPPCVTPSRGGSKKVSETCTTPAPRRPPRLPTTDDLFADLENEQEDEDEESCDECEGLRPDCRPVSGHTPRRRPSIVASTPAPGGRVGGSAPYHSVKEKELTPCGGGSRAAFKRRREELTAHWFKVLNGRVFSDRLPSSLSIKWSSRLTRTAGTTMMRAVPRCCEILLSTKVVDREERLKKTLLHELCHVAQYILERESSPPHGPGFKKWAAIASASCPDIPVSVTHDYFIHKPHRYRCKQCQTEFGRFSKLKNIERYKCGKAECGAATLEYLGRFDDKGNQAADQERAETPYNRFVREEFKTLKKHYPSEPTSALMTRLGSEWNRRKQEANALRDLANLSLT